MKGEDMGFDLIKRLNDFGVNANIGIYITEKKEYENFELVYSKTIADCWYNYISSIKISSKEELKKVLDIAEKEMKVHNRKLCIGITPNNGIIYDQKEIYFPKDKYDLAAEEVWQIYTDFENIDNIDIKCNLDVVLEKTFNIAEFGEVLYDAFSTGNEDDPYSNLDDGYKNAYKIYKKCDYGFEREFYYIKVNEKIVGIVSLVYDNEILGIYGLAIKEEFRGKGIGKSALKRILQICKDLNVKMAFLQTEKGFYPEKIYKKIGFKDVCVIYQYLKK